MPNLAHFSIFTEICKFSRGCNFFPVEGGSHPLDLSEKGGYLVFLRTWDFKKLHIFCLSLIVSLVVYYIKYTIQRNMILSESTDCSYRRVQCTLHYILLYTAVQTPFNQMGSNWKNGTEEITMQGCSGTQRDHLEWKRQLGHRMLWTRSNALSSTEATLVLTFENAS